MFPSTSGLEALAYRVARDAHADQALDPDGRPHIEHVLRVAGSFRGIPRACALLHDVIEDSPTVDADALLAKGFPAEVIATVEALTNRDGEKNYGKFIERVMAAGEPAKSVKIADVLDNLARSRTSGDRRRIRKYTEALEVLCPVGRPVVAGPERTPLTRMLQMYRTLPKAKTDRLQLAQTLLRDPDQLIESFLASRRQFSAYANPAQAFHDDDVAVAPVPSFDGTIKRTVNFASALQPMGVWQVSGAPGLSFRYVDRELDCLRRKPGQKLDDGTRAKRAIVLDLLLADAQSRRPILAELKIRKDRDALYALIQLLAAAAHLTTPNQRERLERVYGSQISVASGGSEPWLDLFVVLFEPSRKGIKPLLLANAMHLASVLMRRRELANLVGGIHFLKSWLDDGKLRFALCDARRVATIHQRAKPLASRAAAALAGGIRTVRPASAIDGKGYVARLEENLLPGLTAANQRRVRQEFGSGKGGELSGSAPKLYAAHSSAALAVNALARWRNTPSDLALLGLAGEAGFSSLRFERTCPTGLRGTPPHLDVIAETSDRVVAVESKCTEPLTPTTAEFAAAYADLVATAAHESWQDEFWKLLADPRAYTCLDAAQLVKHYLGLKRSYPSRAVTLVYLYWEPANAQDHEIFSLHRAEVASFARERDDPQVGFEALSYPELLDRWETRSQPAWLGEHVRQLRTRYVIAF